MVSGVKNQENRIHIIYTRKPEACPFRTPQCNLCSIDYTNLFIAYFIS